MDMEYIAEVLEESVVWQHTKDVLKIAAAAALFAGSMEILAKVGESVKERLQGFSMPEE